MGETRKRRLTDKYPAWDQCSRVARLFDCLFALLIDGVITDAEHELFKKRLLKLARKEQREREGRGG